MKIAHLLQKNITILMLFIFATMVWNIPVPEGLTPKAWHVFVIFITTIVALIMNPLPMGAVALISIGASVLTGTLSLAQGLSGFSDSIIWLVVFAFFLSNGFIKTGFGARIAYHLILRVGKSTLGLSYALVIVDFLLAPFIPSVSARGGGIIFPVAQSLCKSYSDEDHPGVSARNGGFLMKVCFQSNVITSAMFITSMAANPLAVKLAADVGIIISWSQWAVAAFVPGIISLVLMPLVIYYLHPPAIKYSPSAPQIAKEKLEELGKISVQEITMLITFMGIIFLWICGGQWGLSATTVALLGLCVLLLARIINFDDVLADKAAWNTFIWFGTLIMISGFLSQVGLISWVRDKLSYGLVGVNPVVSIAVLSVIYFYIHYFFASATTHIAVLFPTFLALFIGSGMNPLLSALILSFLSIISSGLTHYGLSSAPVFFGAGYMRTKTWWYLGLVTSVVYCIIWTSVGAVWWKMLGLW
jgi:DASS family divalent anion:Na+ symporter